MGIWDNIKETVSGKDKSNDKSVDRPSSKSGSRGSLDRDSGPPKPSGSRDIESNPGRGSNRGGSDMPEKLSSKSKRSGGSSSHREKAPARGDSFDKSRGSKPGQPDKRRPSSPQGKRESAKDLPPQGPGASSGPPRGEGPRNVSAPGPDQNNPPSSPRERGERSSNDPGGTGAYSRSQKGSQRSSQRKSRGKPGRNNSPNQEPGSGKHPQGGDPLKRSQGSVDIPGDPAGNEPSPGPEPPSTEEFGDENDVSSEQLSHLAEQNERIINLLTDIRNSLEGGRR